MEQKAICTSLFRALSGLCIVFVSTMAHADTDLRTFVVRERMEANPLQENMSLKVLKIKGYTVEVKIDGKKQVLKIGQSFSPASADCSVTFTEIATETRLARFETNCL